MARTDVVRALRGAIQPLRLQGRSLLVACSGGPDSTALLLGLAVLMPRLGFGLHVASVDHQLRPSAHDEAQSVLALAARLGLHGTLLRVDVPRGASRQAQARTARYAALVQLASDLDITHLCLGHTRDDQSETMLMRWLGGAGTRGLSGMQGGGHLVLANAPPLMLLRPLLPVSRAQIEAFLQRVGEKLAPLPFSDASNRDPRYLRSRLRHEALPLLRSLAPHLDQHLLELAEQLRADADCLDDLAEQALTRLLRSIPMPMPPGQAVPGRLALPVRELAQLPVALFARVLRRLVGSGLSARHLAALRKLCSSTAGRKWLDLPGCGRVERNRDCLLIAANLPSLAPISRPAIPAKNARQTTQVLDGCTDDA